MSQGPSIRELKAIVEAAGDSIFEAEEKLIAQPIVYDGEGNEKRSETYDYMMSKYEVGDTSQSDAGAPGHGYVRYRITRMDDTGVYGVMTANTIHVPGDEEDYEGDDDNEYYGDNYEELDDGYVAEDENEKPYVCVHVKKGKHECRANSSYEAAKKAAAAWKLKSTAGIDVMLADVSHSTQFVGEELEEDSQELGSWGNCRRCEGHGTHLGIECWKCEGTGDESIEEDYDEEEADPWAEHFDTKYAEKEKFKGKTIIVTDLYDGDVFGLFNKKRFMISSPLDRGYGVGNVSDDEIQVSDLDYSLSKQETAFLKAWHRSTIDESSKPYATMKDGPEKYLFRKDDKQKLVGSADNEPGDGEEELEETDMDKFIREMQIAAGIRVRENSTENGDEECTQCWQSPCECSEEDKEWLADVGNPIIEDCDRDAEYNDDGECSPFTHADDNVAMVREDDDENDFEPATNLCPDCEGRGHDKYMDDCERCGGHGEVFEGNNADEMEEDMLIPPKDRDADGKYDTDETNLGAFDRDMSDSEPFGDDYMDEDDQEPSKNFHVGRAFTSSEIEEGPATNNSLKVGDYVITTWEDRDKYSEPLRVTGVHGDMVRVVDDYGNSELMSPDDLKLAPSNEGLEEGPGDGDFTKGYTDDSMIDVGDDEDYEEYDFDREFEDMLGGSSDPVGSHGAGSMYEMNELRRRAGLPEAADRLENPMANDWCADCESEPCECSEEDKEWMRDGDDDSDVTEDGRPGFQYRQDPDGLDDAVAYEINDEKAYYVMADILGAELDFGPEDEILVPAARNDEVIAALARQGFELGRDFAVAGQMMDDLQNGYSDRAFTNGQDYFPKGSHQSPSSDLGPTANGYGDNAMTNKMRSTDKDDVYEGMKLAYRRFRKS